MWCPLRDPVNAADSPDPVAAVFVARVGGQPLALRTSGATGSPRYVVRSCESWFDSFPTVSSLTGIDRSSRIWIPGPLTGTMNLFAATHARWAKSTLVESARWGATHAVLTPTGLRTSLDHGLLRRGMTVVVAGDRLDEGLFRRACDAGLTVHHYYGAAELSFVAWGTHAADLRPFPGVEVAERRGFLWVRSPYVAQGYDKRYEDAPFVRRDDWCSVGDRGHLMGELVVVNGRGNRAVTTGGATVHAADVEAALRPHLRGDVVVLGIPHPQLGEVVGAVLTDDADLDAAKDAARSALVREARPRVWRVRPLLPFTDTGKLDRAALKADVVRDRLSPGAP